MVVGSGWTLSILGYSSDLFIYFIDNIPHSIFVCVIYLISIWNFCYLMLKLPTYPLIFLIFSTFFIPIFFLCFFEDFLISIILLSCYLYYLRFKFKMFWTLIFSFKIFQVIFLFCGCCYRSIAKVIHDSFYLKLSSSVVSFLQSVFSLSLFWVMHIMLKNFLSSLTILSFLLRDTQKLIEGSMSRNGVFTCVFCCSITCASHCIIFLLITFF